MVNCPCQGCSQKDRRIDAEKDFWEGEGSRQQGSQITGQKHGAGPGGDCQKVSGFLRRNFLLRQKISRRFRPHRIAAENACHQSVAAVFRKGQTGKQRGQRAGNGRHGSKGHNRAGTQHEGKKRGKHGVKPQKQPGSRPRQGQRRAEEQKSHNRRHGRRKQGFFHKPPNTLFCTLYVKNW